MSKFYSFIGRANGMKVFSRKISCENLCAQGVSNIVPVSQDTQLTEKVLEEPTSIPESNETLYKLTDSFDTNSVVCHKKEFVLIKDEIKEDYINLYNCTSKIKYKKITFNSNTVVFTLNLNPKSSYMANIRVIVSKEGQISENSVVYYQGIATITVEEDGNVNLNVPSESVFSLGFSWIWKIGPNLVEFHFSGKENQLYSASGQLDILSNGDTKYTCI